MAVLILPATAVLAFFSYEVLTIWTQNPVTAKNTHWLVSVLIIGTALNGLMHLPSALQLAFGWTKLGLYTNLVSVMILVPMIIAMTNLYGALGAAGIWVLLNCGYIIIAAQIMHERLLPAEKWRWYVQDIALPLAAAFSAAGVGKFFLCHAVLTQPMMLLSLVLVSSFTLAMTVLAAPMIRSWLFNQLNGMRV